MRSSYDRFELAAGGGALLVSAVLWMLPAGREVAPVLLANVLRWGGVILLVQGLFRDVHILLTRRRAGRDEARVGLWICVESTRQNLTSSVAFHKARPQLRRIRPHRVGEPWTRNAGALNARRRGSMQRSRRVAILWRLSDSNACEMGARPSSQRRPSSISRHWWAMASVARRAPRLAAVSCTKPCAIDGSRRRRVGVPAAASACA
jgi:hypothetical protein